MAIYFRNDRNLPRFDGYRAAPAAMRGDAEIASDAGVIVPAMPGMPAVPATPSGIMDLVRRPFLLYLAIFSRLPLPAKILAGVYLFREMK